MYPEMYTVFVYPTRKKQNHKMADPTRPGPVWLGTQFTTLVSTNTNTQIYFHFNLTIFHLNSYHEFFEDLLSLCVSVLLTFLLLWFKQFSIFLSAATFLKRTLIKIKYWCMCYDAFSCKTQLSANWWLYINLFWADERRRILQVDWIERYDLNF